MLMGMISILIMRLYKQLKEIMTITTKKKITVKEKSAKVKEHFIEYEKNIFSNIFSNS